MEGRTDSIVSGNVGGDIQNDGGTVTSDPSNPIPVEPVQNPIPVVTEPIEVVPGVPAPGNPAGPSGVGSLGTTVVKPTIILINSASHHRHRHRQVVATVDGHHPHHQHGDLAHPHGPRHQLFGNSDIHHRH
jgi:hypothetical protein